MMLLLHSSRALRAAAASGGIALVGALGLLATGVSEAASAGTSLDQCVAQPTTTPPTGTYVNGYTAKTNNHTYDFRNARLTQQNLNQYVVRSDGASGVCVLNAVVEGKNDRDASWTTLKNDYNGTSFFAGGGASYWNVRADNIAVDMFRLKPGTSYSIQQAYGTYIRDDCVSFGNTDLEIHDSLFECYTGLSWRSIGGETSSDTFDLVVDDSLFYIQPQPVTTGQCPQNIMNGKGNGNFWKMDGFTGSPTRFHLSNVVIRIDQYNRDCNTAWANATYSNVTLVWTGGGDYWAHIGKTQPAGMTTTSDVTVWDQAKARWLADHACPLTGVELCRLMGAPAEPSPTDGPDTSAPTVSLAASPASVQGGTSANLLADARDNVGVTEVDFYLDDALLGSRTASPYSYPWDSTGVAEGAYFFVAKAYDAAGNSTTSNPVTVTVDDTAPTVSATVSPVSVASGEPVSVLAEAGDDIGIASVQLAVDGTVSATDTSPPYALTWDTTGVASGTYAVTATAYDAAGNAATSDAVDVAVEDRTAPEVAVSANPSSTRSGSTVSLAATASDDVGVTEVELYLDGSLLDSRTSGPYSFTWDPAGVPEGAYAFLAKAYDAAGNSTTSDPVTVTVDDTAPTIAATVSPVSVISGEPVSVLAEAGDDIGVTSVQLAVDGTVKATLTAPPYAFTWNTTGVTTGTYAVTATAYDAAGNAATSDAVDVAVAGDDLAPVVAVSASPTSVKKGVTVSLAATASDDVGVTRVEFYRGTTRLGTDTSAPYSYAWSTTGTAEGAYSITATAYDPAGNTGTSAPVVVTIDSTTPVVSVTASPTTVTKGGIVALAAEASDNVGVFKVEFYRGTTRLNIDYSAPYAYAWSTSGTSVGTYSITAKAFDAAGNKKASTATSVTVTR